MTMTEDPPTTDPADYGEVFARLPAEAQQALIDAGVGPDTPHLVDEVSGAGVPPTPRDAIERAAELAIASPELPGRDEFLTLAMTARVLSMSPGVKKGYRNNPHLCLQAILIGRELGIGPTTALEMIDPIPEGRGGEDDDDRSSSRSAAKGYRLTMTPKLLNARLQQLGLGRMVPIQRNAAGVVLECLGPDNQPLGPPAEFLWSDAQAAHLAGGQCVPSEDGRSIVHSKAWDGKGRPGCGCKSTYYSYPKRMLSHRATGFAADDYYPGARLGLYSPDEVGAITDAEGNAIDPAKVAVPEGFETPALPPGRPEDKPVPKAASADAQEMLDRINALPKEMRDELSQRKQADDRLRGIPVADMDVQALRRLGAHVRGYEAKAAKLAPKEPEPPAPEWLMPYLAATGSRADAVLAVVDGFGENSTQAHEAAEALDTEAPGILVAARAANGVGAAAAAEPTATSASPPPAEPPAPSGSATNAQPEPGLDTPGGQGALVGVGEPEREYPVVGFNDDVKAIIAAAGEADIETNTAVVKVLGPAAVTEKLKAYRAPTTGTATERKTRLVACLLWDEGVRPPA